MTNSPETLARQLLALHSSEYDNEKADERNARLEALAVRLAHAVIKAARP